jgi:glycine/D-amino acid oxidase-like deaminating enzyme
MAQLRSPSEEKSVIRIIGQGLAGSTLGLLLHDLGYKVFFYDNGYKTSSSSIAAGMWNPLSFVNLKKSWMAHQLLPEMERTYTRLEELLGVSFFHPMPLLRIFPDAGSANLWEEKSLHPEVQPYIDSLQMPNVDEHFHLPFGSGFVKGAGWLNIRLYLESTRAFFSSKNAFEEREIQSEEILAWLAQGDLVVQCTGWKPMPNSFWSDVPIHTNKGQVLTLQLNGLTSEYISNFGKFLIPLGNDCYRAGSTYEHGALDPLPSEVAKEIENDVAKSVKHSFSIVDHKSGFRPTTIDRQPILGMHDQHPGLGIFNGLGSRGVMLAPFFAKHFITHLTEDSPVMKEVHWKRFRERRNKS